MFIKVLIYEILPILIKKSYKITQNAINYQP